MRVCDRIKNASKAYENLKERASNVFAHAAETTEDKICQGIRGLGDENFLSICAGGIAASSGSPALSALSAACVKTGLYLTRKLDIDDLNEAVEHQNNDIQP